MDTPLMPDPASGETHPEVGAPTPGEIGGLPGGSAPEHAPEFAAPQPWSTELPPAWPQAHWGPSAGGMPPAPPARRSLAMAFGAALVVGGIAGAVVMGTVGNRSGGTTDTSTTVTPNQPQQNPFGRFFGGNGGGTSGQNPFSGGTGSSGATGTNGSNGSSSTGSSSVDANAIAAKVDPGVVDIISAMSDGTAAGTGMVITSGGQILTNNHVIDGRDQITRRSRAARPTGHGGRHRSHRRRRRAPGPGRLRAARRCHRRSSKVAVGDRVVAIGNALGRGGTPGVADGTVTALNQSITASDEGGGNAENLTGLIQTDAASSRATRRPAGQRQRSGHRDGHGGVGAGRGFSASAGQGFAIPINHALNIVPQLRKAAASDDTHRPVTVPRRVDRRRQRPGRHQRRAGGRRRAGHPGRLSRAGRR